MSDYRFNGGKATHIFKMEKHDDGYHYTREFSSPEAEEAFARGRLMYKVDGSNHLVRWEDDRWVLYARYDDKRGSLNREDLPEGYILLPSEGGNPDVYQSVSVTHRYYYVRVTPTGGKKLALLNQAKLNAVDCASFVFNFLRVKNNQNYFTCEMVGTKFGTPGVEDEVAVAIHAQLECKDDVERTFDGVHQYFMTHTVEGFVIYYQGKIYKILTTLMDKSLWWAGHTKNPDVPVPDSAPLVGFVTYTAV